ncbi:DUF2628 domain-containing protein [Mesorhizobium sp. CGMCC 1.15528]|uniref:DUF2628 domain-containing protein n=1 Tax=Mesorhizobium zhangyense TaxID=1776730 RepID=A0A7C9VE81_9HYPH|nr:DUF2628 domain-containing protein [Mesorhizobium zhangyense]NGN43787.1 DUF2628 domain-containing protein [Mesorhizobium zhangyense]
MSTYVVMEPPIKGRGEASDKAVFVRDRFAVFAFLVPPLWLLWHRLWSEAAFAFAAALALAALGEVAGFGVTGSLLSLLVSIYVGLEGAALRIAALRRRGWREWGVVEADDISDAEIRYLTQAAGTEAGEVEEIVRPVAVASPHALARPAPSLGLVQYPGKA